MKDYFDLWMLLRDRDLDDVELVRAIQATFTRRRTALPEGVPAGLSDAFTMDAGKLTQWRAFVTKNKLNPIALGELVWLSARGCSGKRLRSAVSRCCRRLA